MGKFKDGFTTTGASAGLIALLVTVSTGTAVAAARQITSSNIKNGSIKAVDLGANSVNSKKIVDGTITGLDVLNGSLTRADIAKETLTGVQVKNQSLTGADIASSTLHQVPSALHAKTADTATSAINATNAATATNVNGVRTDMLHARMTDCTDPTQRLDYTRAGIGVSADCGSGGINFDLTFPEGAYAFLDGHIVDDKGVGHEITQYVAAQAGEHGYLDLVANQCCSTVSWGNVTIVDTFGRATTLRFTSLETRVARAVTYYDVTATITQHI